MAVAAATAALCCSTVPPASRTRILLRLAMGQPDALHQKSDRSLVKVFTMSVTALPSAPTFCARGTSLWSDLNHRSRVWGSARAPSLDHPVACSSACWRADSPIGCDAMSSFQWHDQSHHSRAWDTLAPVNATADGCDPSGNSPSNCKDESAKGGRARLEGARSRVERDWEVLSQG